MAQGRLDHPNFTLIRQVNMPAVQAPVSLTDFAHFRSRNKCIVDYVSVHCTSLPSVGATTWSLQVMRGTDTIAAFTLSSFVAVGSINTFHLTSENTLASIGVSISLELDGDDHGKFDVMYEFRLLPDLT